MTGGHIKAQLPLFTYVLLLDTIHTAPQSLGLPGLRAFVQPDDLPLLDKLLDYNVPLQHTIHKFEDGTSFLQLDAFPEGHSGLPDYVCWQAAPHLAATLYHSHLDSTTMPEPGCQTTANNLTEADLIQEAIAAQDIFVIHNQGDSSGIFTQLVSALGGNLAQTPAVSADVYKKRLATKIRPDYRQSIKIEQIKHQFENCTLTHAEALKIIE